MDNNVNKKVRRKSKKILMREKNRRASLMRKCVINKMKNNNAVLENTTSIIPNLSVSYGILSNPGNEIKTCERCSSTVLKNETNMKSNSLKNVKEEYDGKEIKNDWDGFFNSYVSFNEKISNADHHLENITTTLENIHDILKNSSHFYGNNKGKTYEEKKTFINKTNKLIKEILRVKKENIDFINTWNDAKKEHESFRKKFAQAKLKYEAARASEKYTSEVCEDLYNKIAALESTEVLNNYWSQT
uniref:Biogenesis of lysosome-related organelles complex 1 subunit 5 n=1 Tax=Parastrongyloides trichosuri TaxID=131310 RepID=A0A0N5A314_PARTI